MDGFSSLNISMDVSGNIYLEVYWDGVKSLSDDVIVNNEVVDVEKVKLPAVTVCDGEIFRCSGMVCSF